MQAYTFYPTQDELRQHWWCTLHSEFLEKKIAFAGYGLETEKQIELKVFWDWKQMYLKKIGSYAMS